jgi:hypothetical protein
LSFDVPDKLGINFDAGVERVGNDGCLLNDLLHFHKGNEGRGKMKNILPDYSFVFSYRNCFYFQSEAVEITRGLMLQMLTANSVIVVWDSDNPNISGRVEYGKTEARNEGAVEVSARTYLTREYTEGGTHYPAEEKYVYQAKLEGLQPATKYYCRVICGDKVVEAYFSSMVEVGSNFKLAGLSDHHGGYWGSTLTERR